jgi:hypothetical protein
MSNSYILNQRNDSNYLPLGVGPQNSYFLQENSIMTDKGEINEGLTQLNGINGQDLLIIPESPEFDSESSSDNSKSSSNSNSDSDSASETKKVVEFSISENMNFNYLSTYQNLNTISEGNYSKDTNLQKSVMKLIGVYLKEKNKRSFIGKMEITALKSTSNVNNIIKKEKEKEKEKEKKINKNKTLNNNKIISNKKEKLITCENKKEDEEKDVWAFLNEDDEEKDKFQFNLNTSKSNKDKDSSLNENRIVSKTPKNARIRQNEDFPDTQKNKSKFKKNTLNMFFENNFQGGEGSPKTKKKVKKKSLKTAKKGDLTKLKKCTTIIQPKKRKEILKEKCKSNKFTLYESNSKVENTVLSSLDLTINENFEQQEDYIKKLYKTYKIKNEEDQKSDSRIDDASFSGLKK